MHDRHTIRLQGFDYSQTGAYYLSIGTHESRPLLGRIQGQQVILSELGLFVAEHWSRLPGHHAQVRLDAFQVLPTHVHGILFITKQSRPGRPEGFSRPVSQSLSTLVRGFKAACTRDWRRRGSEPVGRIWQGRYLERVIRSRQELAGLRCFVRDNLLWHRLCDRDHW